MRRFPLGLALFAVATLVWAVTYLTREQEYTAATPQPEPIFSETVLPLPGGGEACVEGAVVDPQSEVARLRVARGGPVPLELTLSGAGYDASAWVTADGPVSVPLRPPREPVGTTICVRNLGDREVQLAASDDRTNARRRVTVNGQQYPQNFVLTFAEREPRSLANGLPTSVDRASAFRPVPPALLWSLLALFVFGVPLGVLYAHARAD
jgi:hypothetical protein